MKKNKTAENDNSKIKDLDKNTKYPETNVTKNDKKLTGKIAWAHLKEFPDYYTRLKN